MQIFRHQNSGFRHNFSVQKSVTKSLILNKLRVNIWISAIKFD